MVYSPLSSPSSKSVNPASSPSSTGAVPFARPLSLARSNLAFKSSTSASAASNVSLILRISVFFAFKSAMTRLATSSLLSLIASIASSARLLDVSAPRTNLFARASAAFARASLRSADSAHANASIPHRIASHVSSSRNSNTPTRIFPPDLLLFRSVFTTVSSSSSSLSNRSARVSSENLQTISHAFPSSSAS